MEKTSDWIYDCVDESGESFVDALNRVVVCEIWTPPISPIKLCIKTPYIHMSMEDFNKENVAPIILNHGFNFQISSEEAAKKIREELEQKFGSDVSFTSSKELDLVKAIKDYRKGATLESIAQKVVDIAETFSLDFSQGLLDLQSPSSVFPLGSNILCNHQIGDIMYMCQDQTWLECDGRFLSSGDYPDLYQFLLNCNWDPNWGQKAQMTSSAGVVRFRLPQVHGAWIKAKN